MRHVLPFVPFLILAACGDNGSSTEPDASTETDASRGGAAGMAGGGTGGTSGSGGAAGTGGVAGGTGGSAGGSGGSFAGGSDGGMGGSTGGSGGTGGSTGGSGGTGGMSDAGSGGTSGGGADAGDAGSSPSPGDLDSSFGDTGVSRPPSLSDFSLSDAAVDSSGRIVMVGYYRSSGAPSRAAAARMLDDGTVDDSFDGDGVWISDSDDTFLRSITFAPDGDVVAGGEGDGSLLLVRLESDGSPTAGFGTDGSAVHPIAETSYDNTDVRIEGGEILTAGNASTQKLVLTRHELDTGALASADGGLPTSVDPAFGVYAPVFTEPGNVLVGAHDFAGSRIGLARFDAEGALDTSFGESGLAMLPRPGNINSSFFEHAEWSGGFVTGGAMNETTDAGSIISPIVMQADRGGLVDTDFGDEGLWRYDSASTRTEVRSLIRFADGRVLVGLIDFATSPFTGKLVSLNAKGEPDTSFAPPATDGVMELPDIWPLVLLPSPSADQVYVVGAFAGPTVARMYF